VAVFGTSTFPGAAQNLKETELAAGALRVQLQYLDVLDPKDIETAFRKALVLGALSSILSEHGLSNLRQRAGSRQYTASEKLSKPEGL
jgi:hypothetical protein